MEHDTARSAKRHEVDAPDDGRVADELRALRPSGRQR